MKIYKKLLVLRSIEKLYKILDKNCWKFIEYDENLKKTKKVVKKGIICPFPRLIYIGVFEIFSNHNCLAILWLLKGCKK